MKAIKEILIRRMVEEIGSAIALSGFLIFLELQKVREAELSRTRVRSRRV